MRGHRHERLLARHPLQRIQQRRDLRKPQPEAGGEPQQRDGALLRGPAHRELGERGREAIDVGRHERIGEAALSADGAALLEERREPLRAPPGVDAKETHHEPLGGGRGAMREIGGVERVADDRAHVLEVLGCEAPHRQPGERLDHGEAHRILLELARAHRRERGPDARWLVEHASQQRPHRLRAVLPLGVPEERRERRLRLLEGQQ